jgi:hypothetical protein
MANGLQSDVRAGGVRIKASDVAAKAENLTPNVARMAQMFRQGQISAQEIHERFGSRGIAEDRAAIAQASLATQQATEVGPLQIEAQKAALAPDITQLRQQATRGSLEEQISTQATTKATRKTRDQLIKAQTAQALNETLGGLNPANVRQLALAYPQVVKPVYDPETGIVTNKDEVASQIGRVKTFQGWVDSMKDLADTTESREIKERAPDGSEQVVLRHYFKGGNVPVPQEVSRAIASANLASPGIVNNPETARLLNQTFGAPGQITTGAGVAQPTPPAAPVDPNAPAPIPPPAAAAPAPAAAPAAPAPTAAAPSVLPPPGQPIQIRPKAGEVLPGGGLVLSAGPTAAGKRTDTETRAMKFSQRMRLSESQFQKVLATGIDPASVSMQTETGVLEQIPGMRAGVPVLGPVIATQIEKRISPEAKRISQPVNNWASAILREESGAAIKDEERAQYVRAFFPITGDPPDVRQRKTEQRRAATAALEAVAARKITPAQYEDEIATISGVGFFPEGSSVHTEGSPENKAWVKSGGAGFVTSQLAPDKLITLEPGQLPPADPSVQVIRGADGIARRRRVQQPIK